MMRQLTAKRLSTSIMDTETYPAKLLLRVSSWAAPEDVEIVEDDPAKPTLKVKVERGRTTTYGTIDREAWDEASAVFREQHPRSVERAVTTAPVNLHREQMYR
jgi:hypothetical protein